jgi:hypothetical protein
MRLIVVGINSFHSGKGKDNAYEITENDGVSHVVFQFQNIPVLRPVNTTKTNVDGYEKSEMRVYLTGNFLDGLEKAGVPQDVLWASVRFVARTYDGIEACGTNRQTVAAHG